MSPEGKKLGLIFTPGGFLGAYGAGFATALSEAGFRPDYIQGSSAGALNATALVEDDFDVTRLLRVWREVGRRGPGCLFNKKDLIRRVFRRKTRYLCNLFTDSGLVDLVESNIDPKSVASSDIEFKVVVRNETRNRMEIFSNHDDIFINNFGLLRKIIIASASIAGIFPPVKIGEHYYSDGETISIGDAVRAGCDRIFVLRNEPDDPVDINPHNSFWWSRIVSAKHYHYLQTLRASMKFYEDKITVFRCNERVFNPSSFDEGNIIEAINTAYNRGKEIIQDLD